MFPCIYIYAQTQYIINFYILLHEFTTIPIYPLHQPHLHITLKAIDVFPYFILRDGEAIGFIQYYIHDKTTIGLDMWIGVLKERNNGYGTEALKQMVQLIHQKYPYVKEVFINPHPENKRAIKCYQKAGFKHCGEMMDDGDISLLLKIFFDG